MININETSINKFTDWNKWLKKRIKSNRAHFMKNINLENWPVGKFLEYKGFLYLPLKIDWPEGRDNGLLFVKPVGSVRKIQSGPSTEIITINDKLIKIQVSHDITKKKRKELGKLNIKHPFLRR